MNRLTIVGEQVIEVVSFDFWVQILSEDFLESKDRDTVSLEISEDFEIAIRERRESDQQDLFRSRLNQDHRHELRPGEAGADDRLALPTILASCVLMAGMTILKHTYKAVEVPCERRWKPRSLWSGGK